MVDVEDDNDDMVVELTAVDSVAEVIAAIVVVSAAMAVAVASTLLTEV